MEKGPIKKRYYIISAIVFLLGLILLFLPERKNRDELAPQNLLLSISNEDRFVSPDQIARLIISEDPSIQIIDVRAPTQFAKYSLPGAINIPLPGILDKDEDGNFLWEGYLNDENRTNILYSNGTVYANQAWMLIKRLNFKNNYVLKGGLNNFFKTVILAKRPANSAPELEHENYQFRRGAALFFGGGGTVVETEIKTESKPLPKKKKKQVEDGGGC